MTERVTIQDGQWAVRRWYAVCRQCGGIHRTEDCRKGASDIETPLQRIARLERLGFDK